MFNDPVSTEQSGRPYGGESLEDRSARRRRQLLDAGFELIGTVGYRATTVRRLCREAHVADRYFYEAFPQTEDLLLAVYDEAVDRLLGSVTGVMTTLPADTPLPEVARAGLEAFLTVAEDRRLARVVWLEVLGVSDRVERHYLDRMRDFGALMLAQLSDRRPDAAPPGREETFVAAAAVGGISQVCLEWVLSDYRDPRATVAAATSRFLAGVAGVLAPDA